MRKKITIIVCVVFGLILARYLITLFNTHMQMVNMKKVAMPEIVVEKVGSKDIIKSYESPARVVAKYQVNVEARIDGYLQHSYFKEGDFVKAGQLLFEIEPQEYSNAAGQAKGNLDNAKAQQAYYNKQLARYKELVDNDFVARADYDNVLAQRDAYRAQVQSMENAYRDAQRNLGYTKVKAPVDGRVGIIDVTVGNYVNISSGPLTTINSSDPMYVTFPLESKDYAELNRIDGTPNAKREVEFTFSSGQKYEYKGTQDFYDNQVDESTGTITLRATFPNPEAVLLQGDFGRIKIYSNMKDEMPIVPQTATMENQEGLYVYIMDEENNPKLTYIKTMGQVGTDWVVSSGVKKGDRIITTGMQKVIPGSPVKVVERAVQDDAKTTVKKPNIFVRLINKVKRLLNINTSGAKA